MKALKVVEQTQEPEITSGSSWNGRLQMASLAPNGVLKLRELILALAVRGQLVPQDPKDEPASELLKRMKAEKEKLVKAGKVRGSDKPLKATAGYRIPKTWEWVTLSAVGSIVGGGTPKSDNKEYWTDAGIAWLTPADLYGIKEKYILKGRRDITKAGLENSSTQLLPAHSVLFSSRAPIGYVAIAKGVLSTNQGFKSCIPYLAGMSEYIYWFLKQVAKSIDAAASGTTFKEVSGADVSAISMPLPPLSEQQRIVAKVDELMVLCDRLEAQKEDAAAAHEMLVKALLGTLTQSQNAEEFQQNWRRIASHSGSLFASFASLFSTESSIDALKQTILQLAVMGRLTGSASNKNSSVLLSDLCQLIDGDRGAKYPKAYDYLEAGYCLFLSTKNVRPDGFKFDELMFINKSKHEELRKGVLSRGDVVITTRGTLGNVAIYDEAVPYDVVRINSGMLILRPDRSRIIPSYLSLFIQSPIFLQQLNDQRSGSAQPQIPAGVLKKFTIPLFTIEQQKRIVIKVNELLKICDELNGMLVKYNSLHEILSQALVKKAVA